MKKSFLKTFIVSSFAFLLCVGFFLNPSIVSAQSTNTATQPANATAQATPSSTSQNTVSWWQRTLPWVLGPVAGLASEATIAATGQSPVAGANAIGGAILAAGADKTMQYVVVPLIETLAVAWLKFFSLALGLAGGIFDAVLEQTVLRTTLYDSLNLSIQTSWKLLRDLANIAIVFSLLYLGIKTILRGEGFADTKVLAGVLMAAVFINFSMLFTEIAFGTSNFLGRSIAQEITFSGGGDINSVSENLVRIVGVKDVIDRLWNATPSTYAIERAWGSLQAAVITSLTMMVLMAVFFTAAAMLVYRFIIFIVLVITSPLGLISYFIPWFSNTGKMWWGQLRQQFVFLPAFIFTLYIALLFIGTLTRGVSASPSLIGFFFNFALTCAFLLGVLILPTKLSKGGSNMMTTMGAWGATKLRNLPRAAGRVALSGGARTGRLLGGRLAGGALQNNETLKKLGQRNDIVGSIGRLGLKAGAGLSNRTYDIRNTKLGAKFGMGKGIDNWGDAVKKRKEKIEKKREAESKLLGFDKLHETETAKRSLIDAEKNRNTQAKAFETAKAAYEASGTDADYQAMKAEQDKLEGAQIAVGMIKNAGLARYQELVRRRDKWYRGKGATNTAAVKKIEAELRKKYLEDGKSKAKKNKSGNTNSGGTSGGSGPGGGNSGGGRSGGGTPPPLPPVILGPNGQPARGGGNPNPSPILGPNGRPII